MNPPDLPVASRRNDEQVRLVLPPPDEMQRLDLDTLFERPQPVELEIGIGKGRFLLLAASSRPEVNFLGLEYIRKFAEKSIERLGKRALPNVRVAHTEAVACLERCLGDETLSGVHIYFPDPWPKKRHHKRRMIRPEVLDHLARVMRSGALLRVATDHAAYAEVMRELLPAHPSFEDLSGDVGLWELPGMGAFIRGGVTNFEIKYRVEGRPIHKFVLRRKPRQEGRG